MKSSVDREEGKEEEREGEERDGERGEGKEERKQEEGGRERGVGRERGEKREGERSSRGGERRERVILCCTASSDSQSALIRSVCTVTVCCATLSPLIIVPPLAMTLPAWTICLG